MLKALAKFLPASLTSWLQRTAFLLLAASVSLALVSIAAAEILLAAAFLASILLMRRERSWKPRVPAAILLPTLLFLLWTLFALFAESGSLNSSLAKKCVLFSIILIVPTIARGDDRIRWTYEAFFAVAAVSGIAGLIQFAADPNRDALNRIKGFMSIWMTYSGTLMLAFVALFAYFTIFGWKKRRWVVPLGLVLAAALFLAQTRSAWLGASLGIAAILLMKRPRWIPALIAALAVLYLVSPAGIRQRLQGAWDPRDATTRGRIEVFETALRLIEANPWTGVGQKVNTEALRYRGTQEFPNYLYIHMHNNFLQIAAERGVPGLILWVWFMAALVGQAIYVFHHSGGSGKAGFAALAAIGAWVALVAAGIFEYNFGDSEVLIVFLFMMSAPDAIERSLE